MFGKSKRGVAKPHFIRRIGGAKLAPPIFRLLDRKFEHEILGESASVPADLPFKVSRANSVENCEVSVQHNLLPADQINSGGDRIGIDQDLFHGYKLAWSLLSRKIMFIYNNTAEAGERRVGCFSSPDFFMYSTYNSIVRYDF